MALKIARDQLDEYRELLERKRDLDIQASALKESIAQFEAKVQSQMVADKKQTTTRFGWCFALKSSNLSVAWKKAFIAIAGKDKAVDLVAAGKDKGKIKLVVTPPQDLAHLFEKAKAESDE